LGEPFESDSITLGQGTTVLQERPLAFSAGDSQKLGGWLLELVVRDPTEPEQEKKKFKPLKWRWIVERAFAWVGRNRRLSEVPVIEELAADAQYHRPVPRYECGEGSLAGGVPPKVELLQELLVGEPDHGAALKERPELLGHGPRCQMRHARQLPESRDPHTPRHLIPVQDTVTPSAIVSQVGLENLPGTRNSSRKRRRWLAPGC
jgi:hypothetical protein